MSELEVFRRYDDGYIVRAMRKEDAATVQKWYSGLGDISKYDLDIALQVFPQGHAFYIGELDGKVIASAVRIPWGNNIFYGSYYYVDEGYRGQGYGTRLRDEVAREYVGSGILCVDSVLGKVVANNRQKFGYVAAYTTGRWEGPVLPNVEVECSGTLHKVEDVNFDDIMVYDDKNFVCPGNRMRQDFMELLLKIPGSASYVVKDSHGQITGLGCRRPCISDNTHLIGPLYADSLDTAEVLMRELCKHIVGSKVILNFWYKNPDVMKLVNKFKLTKTFDLQRMHINGDPGEYKPSVFGLTSIDVCGF